MRGFLGALARILTHRAGRVRAMRERLETLHAGFTGRRGARPARYLDDPGTVRAYLASFMLPNAARALHVLDRAGAGLKAGERGLDAGAGTGACALALASLSDRDSEIVLLDRSAPALGSAEAFFSRLFPDGPRVAVLRQDVARGPKSIPPGPFRTVVAGHLLNELLPPRGHGPGRALTVARSLAKRLEPAGALNLLEPAQRVPSRALCLVRDALVREGLAPIGPCTHRGPCPVAGSRSGGWCVTDVPWDRPSLTREVDEMLGIDRRRLTVSHVSLSRSAQPPGHPWVEVLGEPMRAGKGFVVYLCGEGGRIAARFERKPPALPRGSRVRLPEDARPTGRDRSGAPRLDLSPGDLRPGPHE